MGVYRSKQQAVSDKQRRIQGVGVGEEDAEGKELEGEKVGGNLRHDLTIRHGGG